MSSDTIIKKLRSLEDLAIILGAQADNMRDECHKTRLLLEEGVSTSSKNSKVDAQKLAAIVSKRLQKIYSK